MVTFVVNFKDIDISNSVGKLKQLRSVSYNFKEDDKEQTVPEKIKKIGLDTDKMKDEMKKVPKTNANTASLNIYDLQGKQLMQIPITQRGENLHVISGHHFSAGMYLYSLIVDGTVVDTKRMVLTK